MYTNLQFDELAGAVERAWDNINIYDYITPIPQKATIASLVRFVLENNFFTFNKKYYKQKIGASM